MDNTIEKVVTMNPRINWTKILLVLMALFGGLHTAKAYYDPGTQRWLNRDPVYEAGFGKLRGSRPLLPELDLNPYRFVGNEPVLKVDPLGLTVWVCSRKADNSTVANHTYFYDDSANGKNGKCQSCGVGSRTGSLWG